MKDKFDIINESFDLMLQDGMTYHIGICYKNSMDCEMNVFANMLEIIHMGDKDKLEVDNAVANYIRYNKRQKLNLKILNLKEAILIGSNLNEANLTEANLNGANLTEANLNGAYLNGAYLNGANLREARLNGANLRGARLRGADLIEADLRRADLTEADLRGADLIIPDLRGTILINTILDEKRVRYLQIMYNLKGVKIYLDQTKETISYEEYCNRRNNL